MDEQREPPRAQVAAHYGRRGLRQDVEAALRRAGFAERAPSPDDLAPLDQFHTGGHAATLALARLAGLPRGARVLDVGGGIGGPARVLAATFGCQVTVVDLTPEFCEVGALLTARAGLGGRVRFRVGDALALPFAAASFDCVSTQHATMNVPDKAALYREFRRVLGPGGRHVLHEVQAGSAPAHFPAPWARDQSCSWLVTPEATRAALEAAGFTIEAFEDVTAAATQWMRERLAAAPPAGALPPLGVHVLLGDGFRAAFENYGRSLAEGRVRLVRGIARGG